jgi:hypothetical protein
MEDSSNVERNGKLLQMYKQGWDRNSEYRRFPVTGSMNLAEPRHFIFNLLNMNSKDKDLRV